MQELKNQNNFNKRLSLRNKKSLTPSKGKNLIKLIPPGELDESQSKQEKKKAINKIMIDQIALPIKSVNLSNRGGGTRRSSFIVSDAGKPKSESRNNKLTIPMGNRSFDLQSQSDMASQSVNNNEFHQQQKEEIVQEKQQQAGEIEERINNLLRTSTIIGNFHDEIMEKESFRADVSVGTIDSIDTKDGDLLFSQSFNYIF